MTVNGRARRFTLFRNTHADPVAYITLRHYKPPTLALVNCEYLAISI